MVYTTSILNFDAAMQEGKGLVDGEGSKCNVSDL